MAHGIILFSAALLAAIVFWIIALIKNFGKSKCWFGHDYIDVTPDFTEEFKNSYSGQWHDFKCKKCGHKIMDFIGDDFDGYGSPEMMRHNKEIVELRQRVKELEESLIKNFKK